MKSCKNIKRWFRRARASQARARVLRAVPVLVTNSIIYLHTVLEDVRTKSLCV